jgi:pimeloyl-ACP methyl ester carboxylesterase
MFCWNDVVRTLHNDAPDFPAKNKIREKLATYLNRIFDKNFTMPCHLLGKSAGGGVAMHLTNKRDNIKKLFLCCSASPVDESDEPLITKNIPVKLMWNKDDVNATGIDYNYYKKFLNNFDMHKINYSFHSYNTGGHEINPEFVKELF